LTLLQKISGQNSKPGVQSAPVAQRVFERHLSCIPSWLPQQSKVQARDLGVSAFLLFRFLAAPWQNKNQPKIKSITMRRTGNGVMEFRRGGKAECRSAGVL